MKEEVCVNMCKKNVYLPMIWSGNALKIGETPKKKVFMEKHYF